MAKRRSKGPTPRRRPLEAAPENLPGRPEAAGPPGPEAAGREEGAQGRALAAVRRAERRRAAAAAALEVAISEARAAGLTWEKIGPAAGMTGEGVRKRHRRAGPPPAAL